MALSERPLSAPRTIFIAGPTASGKSSAALTLALTIDAEIVNADAMQVYRDLSIVTARPQPDPGDPRHHLYGVIDGASRCSAGAWARMAHRAVKAIKARGRSVIIVGGTGLYFRALEQGLAPMPTLSPQCLAMAGARREAIGAEAFQSEVAARDPAYQTVAPGDRQRLERAWAIYEQTGKPMSAFWRQSGAVLEGPIDRVVIEPPRERLYAQCDARAAQMLETGAIEEVEILLKRGLDCALPIMKAIGVREIEDVLTGRSRLDAALAAMAQATRRYAKRQMTWFRGQAADWPRATSNDDAVTLLAPHTPNR